jgi:D-amino-acid dehydrogenase
MATPGIWRKVPDYLLDPHGPLTIRVAALPGLATWLFKFFLAGATHGKVEQTVQALSYLLHDVPDLHLKLAEKAGLGELIFRNGLLHVYSDKNTFDNDAIAWQLRAKYGVRWIGWAERDLRKYIPNLAARYQFGALLDGAFCRDPEKYVAGLVSHAVSLGANYIKGEVVSVSELGVVSLMDQKITFDQVVISAGAASKHLTGLLGYNIPMRSERSYHIQISDPGFDLPIPVMPSDGKMATTMTNGGLRIAGQVELASEDACPNWSRCDVLLEWACRVYPELSNVDLDGRVTRWMGRRPSVADGLPVISRTSRSAKVIYALGAWPYWSSGGSKNCRTC